MILKYVGNYSMATKRSHSHQSTDLTDCFGDLWVLQCHKFNIMTPLYDITRLEQYCHISARRDEIPPRDENLSRTTKKIINNNDFLYEGSPSDYLINHFLTDKFVAPLEYIVILGNCDESSIYILTRIFQGIITRYIL